MVRSLLVAIGALLLTQVTPGPVLAFEEWPGEWIPGRPTAGPIIELPAFRLEVPFRTQKDGGRWQTSNCGPAGLGMVLDAFGVRGQATDDLRFRSHTYQGTVGMRTGTGLEHVARVASKLRWSDA